MTNQSGTQDINKGRFVAISGLLGAVLASSCCIVPLALVTVGVSGAWIGTLSSLEPYKEYFAAATLIFLFIGFWQVYSKDDTAYGGDSFCANSSSGLFTKSALWIATVLITVALTIDWWAPYFY